MATGAVFTFVARWLKLESCWWVGGWGRSVPVRPLAVLQVCSRVLSNFSWGLSLEQEREKPCSREQSAEAGVLDSPRTARLCGSARVHRRLQVVPVLPLTSRGHRTSTPKARPGKCAFSKTCLLSRQSGWAVFWVTGLQAHFTMMEPQGNATESTPGPFISEFEGSC